MVLDFVYGCLFSHVSPPANVVDNPVLHFFSITLSLSHTLPPSLPLSFSIPLSPSHLLFSNPTHPPEIFRTVVLNSGLLTGKFSRGETPAPGTSRLGWVEENKQARSNQSHPSLSEYADKEKYWQLMDAMKKIANKRGMIENEFILPLNVSDLPI